MTRGVLSKFRRSSSGGLRHPYRGEKHFLSLRYRSALLPQSFKMRGYGVLHVVQDFLYCLTLSEASLQRGNFGPITTFFGLMDNNNVFQFTLP